MIHLKVIIILLLMCTIVYTIILFPILGKIILGVGMIGFCYMIIYYTIKPK